MLLSYAWQNDYCFPGQQRLANDMGVTDRKCAHLPPAAREKVFLKIKRQGQGRTNMYELRRPPASGKANSKAVRLSLRCSIRTCKLPLPSGKKGNGVARAQKNRVTAIN